MQTCKKIMVYPFDKEFLPIIRNQDLFIDYKFDKLVTLSGFGIVNKDAGEVDNGPSTEHTISNDFDESLKTIDTIWITKPRYDIDFNKLIYPNILKSISKKKNIICSWPLDSNKFDELSKKSKDENVDFIYLNEKKSISKNNIEKIRYDISVPIILISGEFEEIQKFLIQLTLRNKLKKLGYNVSQIGTKNYCEFLGFHSFPFFINELNLPDSYKVFLFNHYIKQVEIEENPDVMIIGIPGGVNEINDSTNYDFGLLSNKIHKAVKPDYVIHCVSNKFDTSTTDSISKFYIHNYGVDIDCIHISNEIKNLNIGDINENISLTTQNYKKTLEFINKIQKTSNKLFINTLDKNSMEDLVQNIIFTLSDENKDIEEIKYIEV
ncbi:MAG: TIGR04066 family peptide maturation system protein [Clostridiales bacterium]